MARRRDRWPRRRPPGAGVLLATLLVAGCAAGEGPRPSGQRGDAILALAAASTAGPFDEVVRRFEAQTGIPVRVTTGPSSALAAQIVAGAPADVFLSANEAWARYVEQRGLAAELRPLLGNDLVLAVPVGNPAGVRTPEDLRSSRVRLVAVAGDAVPAGLYAREALDALGLLGALEARRALVNGQDVRVALGYIERREVEAGIVYATDVRLSPRVEAVFTFPPGTHGDIVYSLVTVARPGRHAAAPQLVQFLLGSREAADVFASYGFRWLGTADRERGRAGVRPPSS